ncbi:MAG TPA: LPS export ABC transporter periplasmic protein LptC [Microvirga sp.]|jgi:lipopolysaccharide export system protein LptC|nr:LPS export ABC transporter periplasmic protein LptC [Microvirga sp.]
MGEQQGRDDQGQAQLGLRPPALAFADPRDGSPQPSKARAHAHARARRHSRLVRFLKWAIPVGAVAGVGAVAAVAALEPLARFEGLALGPITLSGTRVTMESPRLTGYRSQSGPYEVTAAAATQDVRRPGLIELQELRARLAIDRQGATARLEATSGFLDTKKELFELKEGVTVRSDQGREVRLHSAAVDFRAGTVMSNEPVTVTFENGTIEAGGVEVSDNGRVLHFKGRVRTTFSGPLAEEAPAAPPTRTSEAVPAPARTSQAGTGQ